MDLEATSPSTSLVKCCECGCNCSGISLSYSGTWLRSVKRKFNEFEEGNRLVIPSFSFQHVARVEAENECNALREMVGSQQKTIQKLSIELEEERNASSSAANEAMSMILRLQREKAEVQMEARQFKRFAEEKMAHDEQEFSMLEDFLYKREQAIQALSCEVQAYKHRMMSYGLMEAEAEGTRSTITGNNGVVDLESQFEFPTYDYPLLKCNLSNNNQMHQELDSDVADVEKYAFGETPRSWGSLKDLECRINRLERSPRHYQPDGEFSNVLEKVIVGHSPKQSRHVRRLSTDSAGSFSAMVKDVGPIFSTDSPRFGSSFRKMEFFKTEDYSNLKKVDNVSEIGDDMSDRVYTVDSVHPGASYTGFTKCKASSGAGEDYMSTLRQSLNQTDLEDPEIKKLYTRLQVLEADRESMRQAIVSMRTDKAQLVLLKEIAQHLCNEMSPARVMPVRKSSSASSFSFTSIVKWVVSFIFGKKKARRSKYMSGLSAKNVGLLILLDKTPRMGQLRCIRNIHM